MKNLIYLLLVFVIGCTVPTETVLEKETIIKEAVNENNFGSVVVFPEKKGLNSASFISFSFISAKAETDFNNGKMYVDNCFDTDGMIHTLDLSPFIGASQQLIVLEFRLTGGDTTEYATFNVKPYGMDVEYQNAMAFFGTPKKSTLVYLITDDFGRVQWRSRYGWPEWKAVDMEIVLRYPGSDVVVQ